MEGMLEFRLHGRGGQGIVVAAAIFAEAVFLAGHYARAFSLFGAERRGAPVTAFIRVSDERLMPRSRIYEPNYVVVFDSSLSGNTVMAGLKEGGILLVNHSGNGAEGLTLAAGLDRSISLSIVDATEIAWKHGLTIGSFPMVNTVMLGAMARISGLASLDDLAGSIKKRVTASTEANINAVSDGYESVREVERLVAEKG